MQAPTDVARKPWTNALKIVALSVAIGPPLGGAVAAIGLSFYGALADMPSLLSGWEGVEALPQHLFEGLTSSAALIIPGALFGYYISWLSASVGAILFALVDRVAPARWPRPGLGLICGLILSSLQFLREFSLMPVADFALNQTLIMLAGAVSGCVCAWSCQRAGWTR